MAINDKQAMSKSYKAQVAQYGTPIADEDYKDLRRYAKAHEIRMSGFKDFVGDISVIKIVIDDICEVASDFPRILDPRRGIVLTLDYGMDDDDFATTDSGHVIRLNAGYFSDIKKLEAAYNDGVLKRHFVQGTDWRAISRHEAGHVVDFFYHVDSVAVAMDILQVGTKAAVFLTLTKELSIYSAMYPDGREIISESFSGYYGRTGNFFAEEFVNRCYLTRNGTDV